MTHVTSVSLPHHFSARTVCDTCVLLLLEDLRKIEASFPTIRNQLINLNASSIAWARLQGLKNTMETLAVREAFDAVFGLPLPFSGLLVPSV